MREVAPGVLDALRRHSTPTICNAVEAFDVRPRDQGFMDAGIRRVVPGTGGPLVGYAVTARIRAAERSGPGARSRADFWEYVLRAPAPRVVVMQDTDPRPVGSYWGEVQANIHRALGCVGAVTDGGVRDLDEMAAVGFACFASCVLVSHAYVHLVEFGGAVEVGGLTVRTGDILHGDQHGVANVPAEIAAEIDGAVRKVAEREARIITACRETPFDLARLKAAYG